MFLAKKLNNGAGSPAAPVDAQFNYVTMLLHGDGTNGAQNNTFLDSGPNNFSITRNGNTTQGSFSPYGDNWSNYFDGSSYLTGPTTNSAFDFGSGDWTIETWAFPTAFSNQMAVLISLDNATSNSYAIGLLINTNGSVQVYQHGGSYFINSTSSTGVITLNTWSHIAAVRSGSDFAIFVNGTRVASVSSVSGTQDANKTVNIGQDPYANNLRFSGYLSNLRVVKGTAVYSPSSRTITVPTTPLTAISGTSLLTCQANRFFDASSNTFAITANGTMSVQRFNPFGTSTAYSTSVIGGSGYFDGTGDYLSTANSSAFAFGTGNFTLEFWYRGTSTTGGFGLLTGGSSGYWQLNLYSGTMYWQDAAGSSNLLNVSASPILNNAWNHVAVVRNSTTTTIYFNGVSVTSATDTTNYSGTGGDFRLGFDSNSNYIAGYIANYRIVKGTAVYTANFTPPTAPLTAISGTSLLLNYTNGAIFDNAMMNDLETVGNAQISTSVKKYGTGSLYFDGTGDYLTGPTTPTTALGSGAYTVEFWLYKDSTGTGERGIFQTQTASLYGLSIFADGTTIYIDERTNSFNGSDPRISGTISQDTWIHVAVCRQTGTSGTLRAFVNGTQIGSSVTSNLRNLTSTGPIVVGNTAVATNPLKGYIDDLRITNGYARYTATFTAPTSAFSDTGPI